MALEDTRARTCRAWYARRSVDFTVLLGGSLQRAGDRGLHTRIFVSAGLIWLLYQQPGRVEVGREIK
jgi:hypothetical protein